MSFPIFVVLNLKLLGTGKHFHLVIALYFIAVTKYCLPKFIQLYIRTVDECRCGLCLQKYPEVRGETHVVLFNEFDIRLCASCCFDQVVSYECLAKEYLINEAASRNLVMELRMIKRDQVFLPFKFYFRMQCVELACAIYGGSDLLHVELEQRQVLARSLLMRTSMEKRQEIDAKLSQLGFSVACKDMELDDTVPLSFSNILRNHLYGPNGEAGDEYHENQRASLDMDEVVKTAQTLEFRQREQALICAVFNQAKFVEALRSTERLAEHLIKLSINFKKFVGSTAISWDLLDKAAMLVEIDVRNLIHLEQIVKCSLNQAWVDRVGNLEVGILQGKEIKRNEFIAEGLKWCLSHSRIDALWMWDTSDPQTSAKNARRAGDLFWAMLNKRNDNIIILYYSPC
jgi:hypothetical protein